MRRTSGRLGDGVGRWPAAADPEPSGANADYLVTADTDADASDEIIGDFGGLGLWQYDGGNWTKPNGSDAFFLIRADVNGDGREEVAADFGSLEPWGFGRTAPGSKRSGTFAEYLMSADLDGDAKDEILTYFGAWGLWLWNEGAWSQVSANNPD